MLIVESFFENFKGFLKWKKENQKQDIEIYFWKSFTCSCVCVGGG
jgi:hypothetical protein